MLLHAFSTCQSCYEIFNESTPLHQHNNKCKFKRKCRYIYDKNPIMIEKFKRLGGKNNPKYTLQ